MRIAIATSDEQKDWYEDIFLLVKELETHGSDAKQVVWDDPKVEWNTYDVIFIDSTWDYTDKLDIFLSWCESVSRKSRLVNDLGVIELSSNKQYLLTLQHAGLTIPATAILKKLTPISGNTLAGYGDRIVVKPLIGANGIDAILFENLKQAMASTECTNLLLKQDIVVQEYMPEIETSGEIGALFIDGQLSHCVLKKPDEGDFRVQYQYGGKTKLIESPAYVQDLYNQVVEALGVRPLYMRLDFIPTETPTIMEIEMVEPNKYLSLYPKSAELLAKALNSQ